ncbi:MAG: pyridoxal 5'-phosphate synthase glutaminase subunit PdxT [Chloroflexi bacterium]|nr:pyridoxal 5'-phosphate synthase glutaminase subunit PdxT [Chloroflexota bacterium]
MVRVGVLALQGDFFEHISVLEQLGVRGFPIRLPGQLEGLDGLIIPGGESTTIGKLIGDFGFRLRLLDLGQEGFPIWGTCAGMIVLAKEVIESQVPTLGLMDIKVRRNAFGRQVESFETDLDIPPIGEEPFRAVFIRAPYIEACGDGVEVLASLSDGRVVAARQGNLLVSAFHPELTSDTRFHRYFLQGLNPP